MWAVKLNNVERLIRGQRIRNQKLYNACHFDEFVRANRQTNFIEHTYKCSVQTEVKGT